MRRPWLRSTPVRTPVDELRLQQTELRRELILAGRRNYNVVGPRGLNVDGRDGMPQTELERVIRARLSVIDAELCGWEREAGQTDNSPGTDWTGIAIWTYLALLVVASAWRPVAGMVLLLAGTVFYFWTER